jgi:drug/metabolite transporter (DMT)-like permease
MHPASWKARLAGVPEGAVGVLFFSLTLPTVRIAVRDLDPVLVGVGRMAVAALLAGVVLACIGSPRLTVRQVGSLLLTTACLAFGFSWIVALALRHVDSHHAAIVIGGTPLATALCATLRGGRRQPPLFWTAALAGSLLVVAYGYWKAGDSFRHADLLLLAGAAICGLGYAEGARLGREIGTAVLTCWVPVTAFPLAVLLCWGKLPAHPSAVPWEAWACLFYNALFSVFIGFFFWYRGLAKGGAARVGQLQLAQPFLTLAVSAGLLHETLEASDWLVAGAVVGCVALAQAASNPVRRAADRDNPKV